MAEPTENERRILYAALGNYREQVGVAHGDLRQKLNYSGREFVSPLLESLGKEISDTQKLMNQYERSKFA
jgi:hypothetical protein